MPLVGLLFALASTGYGIAVGEPLFGLAFGALFFVLGLIGPGKAR